MFFKRLTSGGSQRAVMNRPRMRTRTPTRANLPKRSLEAYGPRMRFKVLGPVSAARDDGAIPLGGPKQRLVLAHLIVRASELVPADVLIDQVWGEEPPEAAKGTLHSYISHLRKALGAERIESRPPGYVLHAAEDELDAARFERLLHEARLANWSPARTGTLLREALALWSGPAFADLAAEPSLAAEIARLEELRLHAIEERIAADLAEGRQDEVVGELEALTRELPLRERLWELLMLALYRSRRPADALSAFERAREGLARELGVDPSPDLRRLHERILREDPGLNLEGEPLRGYRLLEPVGEGAFGVVYRAIQPQVGREVAIKAVHPELANHPDFVRRFDHEAQIVARLEHPHVVPLYDYWREPDAAYLVMRFLRGGSVEDLLEAGPLDLSRVMSITEQIASALSAAHRQGVVHRDVKPGNVLLDEEGNAYITDFGVALDAGSPERSTGTMMRGTPAYLSPEQIRLEPASPRSDVYALGIVVFEMLTGGHPFPDSSLTALLDHHVRDALPSMRTFRPALPREADEVIRRATAKDAGDRYPDITMVAKELRAALEGARVVEEAAGPTRNPYKGLRAFLEADAVDFFGREAVTKRLIRSLAKGDPAARFLAVVGPSGSGKSSMVRAGLVPALRRGAIPGSERWYVIELLPGSHPFRELESALLGVAVEPPPSLIEVLEGDELGIARAVERVLPDTRAELLIVVDQLEELFTMTDDVERTRFLAGLRAATLDPNGRVRFVATLRADFYDAPLSVSGFGDLLAARTEAITPMSPEELERAIVAPADQAGLVVEPRLLAEMIADVADRPGALPLLQYALTELAERADGRTLTLDAYRRIGRVSGALAWRAEQLFEPMNEKGRDACRHLFLRLVTLGEGTEDTRRRVRRSELVTLTDAQTMDAVIETHGHHRLLSFDRDPDTREPTVEIAHEALLREWGRLRDWIDDAREELRQRARISAAAAEWEQAEGSTEYLMTGPRLAQAEEASRTVRLTDTEREFLDASIAHRDAEAAAERMRHARELTLERRARTRLRGLVAVLAAALFIAASLTAVAVNRSREAHRRSDEATVIGLTGASLSNLKTDPELSLRLALHAVDLSSRLNEPVPAGTVEALHWAFQASKIEYPAVDGPIRALAGPLGYRGFFDVPLSELANIALRHVGQHVNANTCERFFDVSACPSLPSRFSSNVEAATSTTSRASLAGTSVTVEGVDDPGLATELRAFGDKTNIDIEIANSDTLFTHLEEDPPDIALVPQPTWIPELASKGSLMDLGRYLDETQLRKDYDSYLLSLATVAPDGSWPAEAGTLYGVPTHLALKSLIWYPVPEFRRAGYRVPATWRQLVALTNQMIKDGRTPWCMGLESGNGDGWPATDWIENLLFSDSGPQTYDRWTSHQITFEAAPVRQAFERMGQIVFHDGALFLGRDGAVVTPWSGAQSPMVEGRPPQCWLYHFPSFGSQTLPRGSVGRTVDAFPFPSPGPGRHAVVGGMNAAVVSSDRPEVREVVRFLADPEFGQEWFASGDGLFSANRRFDLGQYDPTWRRQAQLLRSALDLGTFRVDGSDMMPPEVGTTPFWDAMIRYIRQGPASLDGILAELDAAWPDDTS
jgi:serine/threonine protein kinase/ABC-type glycerol-3-phosphate transport system substrate-binding protein